MNKDILKYAAFHALLATAYVALVATFMNNAEKILPNVPGVFGGMIFLLLFVVSAAVMGILVLGRPILWYLENRKEDAIKLLFYTVGALASIALVIFFVLLVTVV